MVRFKNANAAFETVLTMLLTSGSRTEIGTTKLNNVGFYIDNPLDRAITFKHRNWNPVYAEREWLWYLSEDRSVAEIKKYAPIWDRMHSGDNIVNSNYGYLWNQERQLEAVISQLRVNKHTRQAYITMFDGKNKDEYSFDTPCTLSIGFLIENDKLCMNVYMRSNDIWFGFCNDQYCFSKLQECVAKELGIDVGWYFHLAADMHIYDGQLKLF